MKIFSSKNKKFFLALLAIVAVLFGAGRGAGNPVRSGVLRVMSPFLGVSRGFSEGTRGLFDFLGSIGKLKDQNEKLIQENLSLTAQIASLGDVRKENDLLRDQVGLLPRDKYSLEAASIVGQSSLGAESIVLIDKGGDSGISEGMPVIISNGVLVGKVSQVYGNTAQVLLITDRAAAVNGEVLESGAKGIVEGTYGLGISMNMISQKDTIHEGDTVISSGLGGETPRGLFIGKIGRIGQSEDKLFQQASVASPVDFSALRILFVIKKF